MPFFQSALVAFVSAEFVGYVAAEMNIAPADIRLLKCAAASTGGIITAFATADPGGGLLSLGMGAAYLGGLNPLHFVVESSTKKR